jgi:multidrug efflux pump subunit AcrB
VFSAWIMKPTHRGEATEGLFGRVRSLYELYLRLVLRLRWPLAAFYVASSLAILYTLVPRIGTEIFPDVDSPLYRLRLKAPAGTRIEETERIVLRALDIVRREAGEGNVAITSDFLGVQPSSYPVNLIHLFTAGPQEAILQLSLKPHAVSNDAFREKLRDAFRRDLPGAQLSFEAGDIVSQVMSFGAATPIEVAVQGVSLQDNYAYAQKVRQQLARLPFLRDLQFAQDLNYPTLDINIDRNRAGQFGLTMADVARSVNPATSSSRFTAPNFWRDPASGNAFQIQVQLPQNRIQSVEQIGALPVMKDGRQHLQLSELAELKPGVVSLTANIHGLTLGQAAAKLQPALAAAGAPPRGVTVKLRGQIPALEQTVSSLSLGLLLAALAIFLLLAASFQSMRLALAILLTAPAVLCGVALMLLATGTTLNIQSFMGAIMAIGIAVANSILLVSFRRGAGRRHRPSSRHPHDGLGDDRRHVAHGVRRRGVGRAGRAARPRRHRRTGAGHLRHPHRAAVPVHDPARQSGADVAVLESQRSREPIL